MKIAVEVKESTIEKMKGDAARKKAQFDKEVEDHNATKEELA